MDGATTRLPRTFWAAGLLVHAWCAWRAVKFYRIHPHG